MWHLVGIAIRLVIQLGLHRENTYSFKTDSEPSTPEEKAGFLRQEISRNCFWSTIAMDRYVLAYEVLV
jgi:hypothetical protein